MAPDNPMTTPGIIWRSDDLTTPIEGWRGTLEIRAGSAVDSTTGPLAELARLRAEVEDLTADRDSWIEQASARTADAVQFMQERDAVRAEAEVLRADALKQVDCRQCKHATNRGCHSTALCERGELFEATPPWQFYDAARAAQGER